MNNTPWTYHEFHHSPGRKSYSVMEGIRVVASCSREKDARLIVSMKEINAELLEVATRALAYVWDLFRDDAELLEEDLESLHLVQDIEQAITKAKVNGGQHDHLPELRF